MNVDYTQTENYVTLWPSQGEFLQSIVVNPNDVLIDYDRTRYTHGDIQYLIITSEELAPTFESLAEWKSQQGIPAKVVTTQEIYSNPDYDELSNQGKIKHCIKDYVSTKRTEYVLLGGSDSHVPRKEVSIFNADEVNHNGSITIVTDYYYASLVDEPWVNINSNHNFTLNGDVGHEVAVGRVACDTSQKALNFIDKLKNYEKYEGYPNGFSNDLLLAGSWMFTYDFENFEDDYHDTSEWLHRIKNHYISNHQNFDCKYYLDYRYDDFPYSEYEQNTVNTGQVVSEGYNLTMWLSHGLSYAFTKKFYDPLTFDYSTVASLTNQYSQGLMYSMACNVADYRSGCLGESLIEAPNGGYIGFIGHSSRNWVPVGAPILKWGLMVGAKFINKLTTENNSTYGKVSAALSSARLYAISKFDNNNASIWPSGKNNRIWLEVLLGLTYLGDPSLKVWTSTPSSYSIGGLPSYILKDEETSINVSGFDVPSTLCISNGDDIYEIYSLNINEVISLSLNPTTDSPIVLTVTGRNKIPYQVEIPVRTRVISGTVLLEDSSTNVSNIQVELVLNNGTVLQTTHPNASGEYHFEVPVGEYKVIYSLFDYVTGFSFYPYSSSLIQMDDSTPELHITLPLVTLYPIHLGNMLVKQTSNGDGFSCINAAMGYIENYYSNPYNNEAIRITISPGTYPESIVIGAPGITIPSLEIKGDGGQPTITGGYGSLNRTISVHPQASIGQLILRDLDFAGGRQSGQVFVPNNVGDLQIINCSFHDLIINHGLPLSISDPLLYHGTAIQSYSPTLVSGCDFYHNQGVWTQDPDLWDVDGNYYSSLGILYLTGNSIVENCQIYDNSAAVAGAIHLSGANNIIRNNTISSNITLDPSSEAVAIRAYNAPGTIIRDNIFLDNGIGDGQLCNGAVIWMGGTTNQSTPSSIANNTFINEGDLVTTDLRAIRLEGTANVQIQNNVLSNFPKAITNNSQFASDQILKNNLFWDNATNFTGSIYNTSLNPGNCIFDEDPELDANYFPIWNSSTISPCIDSGLGVDAGDGTPADIGAKRAVHHQSWDYTFSNQADQEKWHWVSYPVLNSRTGGALVASEFFQELLQLPI
jgi:hypothetical protein